MAFKQHDMSARIITEPAKAKADLLAAYRRAGASVRLAAKELDCNEHTFLRWARKLGAEDDLRAVREEGRVAKVLKERSRRHGLAGGRPPVHGVSVLIPKDPDKAKAKVLSAVRRGGSRLAAAQLLGCSVVTLREWITTLGLERDVADLRRPAKSRSK